MHTICRGKIRLFWCFYGVTYNFIQNHNHWRDLHQIFSCLFETFGTMFAIMFSSDSMSKKKIQQLKIHECLLSFTTSLFWNGWETMVQKFENDRNFLLNHCWFKLISIVIHIQAIFWERSGSVVECLTQDRRAAGSSLTGVTALCPWARTLILA